MGKMNAVAAVYMRVGTREEFVRILERKNNLTMRNVLNKPNYAGEITDDKLNETIEVIVNTQFIIGKYPPIIGQELRNRVQILNTRKKYDSSYA
ncbi:hypothetical protein ACLIBH_05395 [Virgibacillus sp. W0430]|uniref:hypothetical protein n=1 Tax=Virgibacillus sp. W0430 TaxID=3391580 RepID=UPI003F461480